MANKTKIGASIVLDGEKKYKEAVTGCNNKLKELRAELGLVKEKYAENANSMEALNKKAEVLDKIFAEQGKKQEETQEAYDHAESSRDELKASVEKLKNEYEQEKKKLEEIAKASGTSTEEYRNQKKVVEELEKAHQKGENTLKRAENRVSNWTTKLKTAETQSLRAGKAVEQNKKYIDEADASFDNCAKSIDRYGKKTKDTEQYTKEGKLEKDASGHICREANGLPKVKEQYAGEYEQELVELLGFTVEVDLFYLPEETLDYEDAKYDPLSLSQMRCVAALCMKE